MPDLSRRAALLAALAVPSAAWAQPWAFPGQPVNIVPKTSVVARIDAARTIFNRCVFDADKTAEGLNVLARWKYKVNPDTKQWSKDPEHDDNSHGGDAFTYMAVAVTVPRKGHKIAYSNKGIV